MGDSKVKSFHVKALFDFSNDDPATISLKRGDLLTVYRTQDEWMYGVCVSGKAGFFPAVFVEILADKKQQQQQTVADVDLGFSYDFIGSDLCRAKLTEEFGLGHIVIKVPKDSSVFVLQEATLAKIAVKRAKPSLPAPMSPSPATSACPTSSSSDRKLSQTSPPTLSLTEAPSPASASSTPKKMSSATPVKKMSFSSPSPTTTSSQLQSSSVSSPASSAEFKQKDSSVVSSASHLQSPPTQQLRSSSREPSPNKQEPPSPKQDSSSTSSPRARERSLSTSQIRGQSKEPPTNRTATVTTRKQSVSGITSSSQVRSLSKEPPLSRSDSSLRSLSKEPTHKTMDQQPKPLASSSSSRSLSKEPPSALKRTESQQSLRSASREPAYKSDTSKQASGFVDLPSSSIASSSGTFNSQSKSEAKFSDAASNKSTGDSRGRSREPPSFLAEQQPKDPPAPTSSTFISTGDSRSRSTSAPGRPTILQSSSAPIKDRPVWSNSASRAGTTNTKFSAQPASTPMAKTSTGSATTSKTPSSITTASSNSTTKSYPPTKTVASDLNSRPLPPSPLRPAPSPVTTTTSTAAAIIEPNSSSSKSCSTPMANRTSSTLTKASDVTSSPQPAVPRQVQRSASKSALLPLSSTSKSSTTSSTTSSAKSSPAASASLAAPTEAVKIATDTTPQQISDTTVTSATCTSPGTVTSASTLVSSVTAVQTSPSAQVVSTSPATPSTTTPSASPVRKCTVLHAFHQKDSAYTMLFLEVGDIVTILREEGDWIEGECKGAKGYVPKSFVKEDSYQQPQQTPQQLPLTPSHQQQASQPQSSSAPEPFEGVTSPRLKSVMANLDKALLDLKLDGPATPRILAAIELVETERRYVEDLQILQQAILLPLQKSASELSESKGFVDHLKRKLQGGGESESINSIVSQWTAVCARNVPFLTAIQACVQQWHALSEKEHVLGPILLEHLPKFTQTYGKYCAHYYSMQSELTRVLNKHSRFSRVRKNADESGLLQGRTISSYLISPIQRVPRYQMLIGELLKCTGVDHIDYERLQEALRVVMEVGKAINESVRIQENHELTMKLELTFDHSPLFSAQPRELLRYGELMKLSNKSNDNTYDSNDTESTSPLRTFFLFEDMLAYARVKVGDKLTLRARWAINSNFEVSESNSSPLQLIIKSVKSITLVFTDLDEKTNWLNDIQRCIQMQQQKTACGYCRSELPLSSLTKCSICFATVCSSCSRIKNNDNCCITCQDFNKVPLALQRKTSVLALRPSRKLSLNAASPSQLTKTLPLLPTPSTPTPTTETTSESTENLAILDCPQGHGLSLNIALQEGYGCDSCGLDMQIGERMQCCVPCNYFVCVACQHRPGVTLKVDSTQMEIDAMIEKAQTGFLDRFIQGVLDDEDDGSPQISAENSPTAATGGPPSITKKFSLRDLRQLIPRPLPSLPNNTPQRSLPATPDSTTLSPPSAPTNSPPRSISPQRILSNTFAKARRASGI